MNQTKMENNNFFDCLIIKQGKIDHLSWNDPNYISNLLKLDLFETIRTNNDNFVEFLATNLNIKDYNIKNLSVKTEIICDEPNYVYELMYIDTKDETFAANEMANLININGEKVYSNAILFKNFVPSLTDSMYVCDVSKKDLEKILYDRVHTKVVIYDEEYKEKEVVGDLNFFASSFLDDEFKKLEIPFLMHNINIWYTEGYDKVCGKLIKEIDKCIWFTMKSDEYRGNLTLDEVKKIIHLSDKLKDYNTPLEFLEEKFDSLGRKIVYNKYKILDFIYEKNL